MPQALIEAMARGKICIVSNNLGNLDIISDGVNGFVFENGNASDLAKKLNHILKMPDKQLQKIAKNGRKSVEQFAWNKIVNKIDKLIKQT